MKTKGRIIFAVLSVIMLIAALVGALTVTAAASATVTYDGQTVDISSVSNKTFIVLKKLKTDTAYTLVGGYDNLTSTESGSSGALQYARTAVSANGSDDMDKDDVAVILMMKDYTNSAGYSNTSMMGGTVVLDLMGHTLTTSSAIFAAQAKYCYGDSYYEIRNGYIATSSPLVSASIISTVNASTTGPKNEYFPYDGIDKLFDFLFYDVRIGFASGAANTTLIASAEAPAVNKNIKINVTLDSCNLDLNSNVPTATAGTETVPKKINLVSFSETNKRIDGKLIIRGSKLKLAANTPQDCYGFSLDAEDTVSCEKHASGVYMDLSFPYLETASYPFGGVSEISATNGKSLSWGIRYTRSAKENVFYTLGEPIPTEYGDIPYRYSHTAVYPLAVFMNGSFKSAATSLSDALTSAKEQIANNGTASVNILLRRGLIISSVYSNMGQMTGEVNIDLDGFTLTSSHSSGMLNLQAKNSLPLSVNIFSGKIAINTGSIAKLSAYGSGYTATDSEYKVFSLGFTDVDFHFSEGSTADSMLASFYDELDAGLGNKRTENNFSFTRCSFDLTRAKSGLVLFNANDTLTSQSDTSHATAVNSVVSVTVSDSEIISDRALSNFTLTNVNKANGSSVVFSDTKNTLALPKDSPAPTASFMLDSGKAGRFLKTGSDGDKAYFALTSALASEAALSPKMNITLSSDILLNMYIRKSAVLEGISVGSKRLELSSLDTVTIDGGTYYAVRWALGARRAMKSVTLTASLKGGSDEASLTYTFSLIEYLEELLSGEYSEKEKQLAKDLLSYLRAAYSFFEESDPENTEKINLLLGEGYDEENPPISTPTSTAHYPYLRAATLNLTSYPAVRFYPEWAINSSDMSFFIGKHKLPTRTGSDEYGKYIDAIIPAYLYGEAVTYKIRGVTEGSYKLTDYLGYTEDREAGLYALVRRFVRYCESAAALKSAETSTVPHTHSFTETSHAPTRTERGCTEKLCSCGKREITYTTGVTDKNNLNIYFIGNSHTYYNDLAVIFRNIASTEGYYITTQQITVGSSILQYYADPTDATHGAVAQAALRDNDFDFVFLQDSAPYSYSAPEKIYDGVRRVGKIVEDSGAEVILYQNFARKAPHADLTKNSLTSEQMSWHIAATYEAIAKETGYTLSPAGSAMCLVHKAYPSIELYVEDHNHPSPIATYLIALCHYATLTGKSPIGISYTYGLDKATVDILQQAAHTAVFGGSIVPEAYKKSSEGVYPNGGATLLSAIPGGTSLISANIAGTKGTASSVQSSSALTNTQKADLADIGYGISLIGAQTIENGIGIYTNGVWKNNNANRARTTLDGKHYFIDGTQNDDEPYVGLITLNFGTAKTVNAVGFVASSTAGMPQAIDIYVSNDGESWSAVSGASYNGLTSSSATIDAATGGNEGVMLLVSLGTGGVKAKYVRIGVRSGTGAACDLNFTEVVAYGK